MSGNAINWPFPVYGVIYIYIGNIGIDNYLMFIDISCYGRFHNLFLQHLNHTNTFLFLKKYFVNFFRRFLEN